MDKLFGKFAQRLKGAEFGLIAGVAAVVFALACHFIFSTGDAGSTTPGSVTFHVDQIVTVSAN
jgi:hypothetical protein